MWNFVLCHTSPFSSLGGDTQGYNITNKRVLNWLPLPWFVSWAQLVFGLVYCVTLWAIKLRKRPIVPQEGIKALSVVALCHTIGHVSTVCSLGAVAVSYVLASSSMSHCHRGRVVCSLASGGIISLAWHFFFASTLPSLFICCLLVFHL